MKWIVYVLLPGLLLLLSCKRNAPVPAPRACFENDKRLYAPGETVRFSSCSENAERLEWNFGDGHRSAETQPTFSWSTKGPHLVLLTAYNSAGSNDVRRNVYVADSTYAGFRAIFSNWKPGYRDSLFTFSVYALQNGIRTTLFQRTQTGAALGALVETPVRVPDVDQEFRIEFVMRSPGGAGDSLVTAAFTITDAVSHPPALSSQLKFVTVEHVFTLFYK